MAEPTTSDPEHGAEVSSLRAKPVTAAPNSVLLVAYPKVIFLYPIFFASVAAAIVLHLVGDPLEKANSAAAVVSAVFLCLLAINLVILGFDFPRTTSLTLFFFAAALVMGLVLLFTFQPDVLPMIKETLAAFRPLANPTFYWSFAAILGAILVAVLAAARFDYWEVRPNELLHHHGVLSNLERFSAPHLRIDKEINDVFEYLLLQSGRLILQASDERRAIILDNVPRIKKKEEAITRMLGALQVQVRPEGA